MSCLGESNDSARSMYRPHQIQKVMPSTSALPADLTAFLQQNFQPIIPGCHKQAEEEKRPDVILPAQCSYVPSLPQQGLSLSVSTTDSSTSIPLSCSIRLPTGTNTSLHNKIIIHPRGMNMTYPTGSTMLPVTDSNWVAVCILQSSQ
ncbi:uncharacterized protein LOC126682686 [Mercurialis annua]|uniref:uncharacterized protein LOC126682686 n=1 Tax=Mercurialis annua TaxID=3986 RepID=UPI00215E7F27|nr:uncharacterized protein LOC126682686 [Mercurialis annua]